MLAKIIYSYSIFISEYYFVKYSSPSEVTTTLNQISFKLDNLFQRVDLEFLKIIDTLENNIDKVYTLKELKDIHYYHPKYIQRMFYKYTGKNFKKVYWDIKLKQAIKLRNETNLSPKLILNAIGYSDNRKMYSQIRDLYMKDKLKRS